MNTTEINLKENNAVENSWKKQSSKFSRREFIVGAGAIALTGVLAGCKGEVITTTAPGTTHTVTVPPVTVTVEPSPEERPSFTVIDMLGRTVTIPGTVNKVATFGANGVLNTMTQTMGMGSTICHQMQERFTKGAWKYQNVFSPQLNDPDLPAVEFGGEIDIEAILKLNPDVCLVMTPANAQILEDKGLSAIYLRWQTLDDIPPCISLLGKVFGKEAIAGDYLNYFYTEIAEADLLTAKISEADRKRVVYGSITSYTQPHAIAEWWIYRAGGYSVTSDGRDVEEVSHPTYTAEDLLMWDPEVIVTTAANIEEIRGMDILRNVTALKNNEIYYIPTVAHVWGNRTTEQTLTIFWMMNKLYPDLMPLDTLKEKVHYFYDHFFLTDLTDEQLTEILGG